MNEPQRHVTVLLAILFLSLFPCKVFGQDDGKDWVGYYGKPVNIEPLTLSGSMGEFRATHFHTGYDFRVGGVVGAPVYAVADGYISRITVSPGGYGNALYITHPNETVSLYGHLDAFSPEVAAYVKEEQYRRESFQVSLDCPPGLFPVRKGQQVGKAGNTGDSAGPHLHFELRYNNPEQGASRITANLLQRKVYEPEDTLPPEFRAVQFYGYSTDAFNIPQTRLVAGFDASANRTVVHVPDTFFVAADAIDRMNHTWSRMGIERWEVYLDNELVYRYRNEDLPLDMSRYILSLTYFPQRAQTGRSLLKTWVEPGNKLADTPRMYAPTKGLFTLPDSLDHTLRMVVYDAAGNNSSRSFILRRKGSLAALVEKTKDMYGIPAALYGADAGSTRMPAEEYQEVFRWDSNNHFEAQGISVQIPEYSLYKDILFWAARVDAYEWVLHTAEEPLHQPMHVQMKVPSAIPEELYSKVFVLRQSDNGRDPHMQEADPRLWRPAGGQCRDSVVTFSTNAFGRFRIDIDTIPPSVQASFATGADVRGRKSVYFIIKDNESGLETYEVVVDGKWVLGIYDAKRSRVTCVLDPEVINKGNLHNVVVKVADKKANVTEYTTSFLW